MRVAYRSLRLFVLLGAVGLLACENELQEPSDAAADEGGDDMSAGEPDAEAPDPDVGPPAPDMDPPAPDMDPPAPDMDPPAPDMDPPCAEGETRACAVDEADDCVGQQICLDGEFGPCETPDEVCDGEDNDCNGAVDDVEGAGDDCSVGIGACAAAGSLACGPDGELVCDAVPGEGADEVCGSGVDEDCDGELDEPTCICAADDQCGEGELCVDEACLEGDCREDAGCGEGELCIELSCVEGDCRDDAQCGEGELCIELSCVEGDCRDDAGCGEGELCIDNGCRPAECRANDDCDEGEGCVAYTCEPLPAACLEPQRIDAAGAFRGDTRGGPSEEVASCGGMGPEQVYVLDLGLDGPVCLDTFGSFFDTALYVRSQCGDPDSQLACNDDRNSLQSQVQLDSGAEPVFVFVDGYGNRAEGNFTLNVTPGQCPCVRSLDCDQGEVCDDGECRATVCGDGLRERGEECDDGNAESGDGCDDTCSVEDGYVCFPQPGDAPQRCRLEVCAEDGECFDEEICIDRACVVGDCRQDGDCADGQSCIDMACQVVGDEICDNGIDDDLNGRTDCADDACFDSPACPCPRDDRFEDLSDNLPGAVLPPGRTEDLANCDQDIYQFELCAGGTTRVTVEFDHEDGDINAELGDGTARLLVDAGNSQDDDEVLEYTNGTGEPARMDILLRQRPTDSGYAIDIEIFDCDPDAERCADDVDDDGDGLVDCLDPDCAGHPLCPPAP